ncbi:hypothetical protein BS47DRAFT_311987 [Hydnum rufescens UP504]|uniref:Uncharacterized protein n=1 Tax=Hydnum rufescens UP504 TaxID=1448309 RepID=A0A9P6DMX6_9AGAM|nr:hypothetical protein BS47DRAFT_311987 [Hydnum rufescens UP504]
MLRRSLFGEASLEHVKYREFERGLNLTCSNGFQLFQLFDSFEGGNQNLLGALDLGYFDTWASVQAFVSITVAREVADALSALPSFTHTSFQSLFDDFMTGTGIPPGQLVADVIAAGNFPENLAELATHPGFHSRCLFFSATMRERHDGETQIRVSVMSNPSHPVSSQNASTGEPDDLRALLSVHDDTTEASFRWESIKWGTCSSYAIIPGNVIIRIFLEEPEPIKAVFCWLFMEIVLNANTNFAHVL